MATLGNKKTFNGMVGNVVFRTMNNKQIVQSRPSSVKQTTATKKSATEFGSCSRWAKQVRIGLTPFLVGLTDGAMYQRFTTTVYNAVKSNSELAQGERNPLNSDMKSLEGFEFNAHSPFASHFLPAISAEINNNKEVLISLSAFDPKTEMVFPLDCNTAKLAVFVYATDLLDPEDTIVFHNLISIDKNRVVPAQTILTTAPIPEGYFVLASVKLLYYNPNLITESTYLNTKTFSPAMVVLAEAVGV